MRQRGVHTRYRITSRPEEQARKQTSALNAAREIAAAIIEPTKRYLKPIAGNILIPAEDTTEPLPEIGNDHDIGLVIARAGFDPCFPLAHLVGSSQVCVPISTADFQTAELVDQEKVHYTRDRVRTVHGRRAIL